MKKNRRSADSADSKDSAVSAVSIREFARGLRVSERTIRNAIQGGRIPKQALVRARAANGKMAYAIADTKLAAAAWAEWTPVNVGGRLNDQAAVELVQIKMHRRGKHVDEIEKHERKHVVSRAAARNALESAIKHTLASTAPSDQAKARRVAGKIRQRFLQELKRR